MLPMLVSDPDLTSLLLPPLPPWDDDVSGTSCSERCPPPLPWSDRAALLTRTLPLEWVGWVLSCFLGPIKHESVIFKMVIANW